ncbi:MAG: c-type cytochrome [Chloroflexi bacterium]|nr:MAG: c-type cytochrome [Chloroflexota bacterium]
MRTVWRWLELRLELKDTLRPLLAHPIPRALDGRVGWFYVLGISVLTAFVIQVVSGVALAITYVPSSESAYDSLKFITDSAALGRFIRGVHWFGACAMVLLIVAHVTRVFLMGAYKFPREINWLSGSLLFLATLLMAFTGQTLRWDQDAFWSLVVGAEQAARTPLIGDPLTRLIVGGYAVSGATVSRVFATHVFVVPGAIALLVLLHVYLVVKRGVSEPPRADEPVDRAYMERYEALVKRGLPYFPYAAWRDAAAAAIVLGVVTVLALVVGPPQLGAPPDPSIVVADPRPDWFFIGYFTILALMPKGAEAVLIIGIPAIIMAFLFLLPFARPFGQRHPLRRPLALTAAVVFIGGYTALTFAGYQAYWVPLRLEGALLPASVTGGLSGAPAVGARLFIDRSCWSCHMIDGSGGRRGPDLTHVAARLSEDRLITRIASGGPGMPDYAAILSKDELANLVAFLGTRR